MKETKVVPSVKSLLSLIKDIDTMDVTPEKKVFYIQSIVTYINMMSDLHSMNLILNIPEKEKTKEIKEILKIVESYSITKEQII